jgi:multidrug efflux system membrane fusion protein
MTGCQKATPPPARPPRTVAVATAHTRDTPLYLDEIGNCTAYETVTLQPQVSGQIVGIHFQDGQEVKKGDLLFSIDPRPYQAALDQAVATREQNRARARYAQSQLTRTNELRRTNVVAAQEQESAESTAKAATATVEADEANVKAAQLNREFCDIHSPIDGRASKRMVDLGNIVAPNTTQLLLIQRQDPIYVEFTIPERELPRVRHYLQQGSLKVAASFPDSGNKATEQTREGTFDFLDSGVQPGTGTVRMRALLPNADRLFWPGQFINVRLLLDTVRDSILIPNEAVQIGQQGTFVFIVKADATVELRPVQVGQRQGDDLVITQGLQPGETVVVTGQIALAPGTKVNAVPANGTLGTAAASKVTR